MTLEALRDALHAAWQAQPPGPVKGLLWAAFTALVTACHETKGSEAKHA